jgi:hypothetical protein
VFLAEIYEKIATLEASNEQKLSHLAGVNSTLAADFSKVMLGFAALCLGALIP